MGHDLYLFDVTDELICDFYFAVVISNSRP